MAVREPAGGNPGSGSSPNGTLPPQACPGVLALRVLGLALELRRQQ